MIREFEIVKLFDHHNRGQFIVARQLNFKETIEIKEGDLLNGIPVYHYLEMYPFSKEQENPQLDIYVFRPVLVRFPDDYFQVGQIVELVTPEISRDKIATLFEERIREAVPKLLEMARELTWNNIPDNCKFIATEIQNSRERIDEHRKPDKKINDMKTAVTLTELIPALQGLYNVFYDINLYVYKATRNVTIIDLRYYLKSSLDLSYQEKVLHEPPMIHCKVAMPPWLLGRQEKFDINWEHHESRNRLRRIWMRLKWKVEKLLR